MILSFIIFCLICNQSYRPDLGGKEAIRHLLEMDKNVRAIVSSGYSNDPVLANYSRYGFCGAVKKPYPVQEMSQILGSTMKK